MSLTTLGAGGGGGRWFVGAAAAIDFANNWTLSGGTPTSLLTCTRATTTSYAPTSTGAYTSFGANVPRITDLGLLTEEARTNLFLNSQAPATQSVTVVNASVYTVSVIGTGSITLSGAGTGTVSQGSPVTFTASTTSLTCTTAGITGSFVNVNVELGAFATSPIVTAGASASRAQDVVTLTTVPVSGTTWSAFSEATLSDFSATRYLLAESGTNRVLYAGANTSVSAFNGANITGAAAGSGGWSTGGKAAVSADGTGRSIAMNNGTVGGDANTQTFPTTLAIGGATGATGVITTRRIALWSVRLPNAQLQALTA